MRWSGYLVGYVPIILFEGLPQDEITVRLQSKTMFKYWKTRIHQYDPDLQNRLGSPHQYIHVNLTKYVGLVFSKFQPFYVEFAVTFVYEFQRPLITRPNKFGPLNRHLVINALQYHKVSREIYLVNPKSIWLDTSKKDAYLFCVFF